MGSSPGQEERCAAGASRSVRRYPDVDDVAEKAVDEPPSPSIAMGGEAPRVRRASDRGTRASSARGSPAPEDCSLRSPSGSRSGGTGYARLVELETIDVGETLVVVHRSPSTIVRSSAGWKRTQFPLTASLRNVVTVVRSALCPVQRAVGCLLCDQRVPQ